MIAFVQVVLLCLCLGLIWGFAPGSINRNRNLKQALLIGLMFGTISGGFAIWVGTGWLVAIAFYLSCTAGSLIACYTPNKHWLKRYFDENVRR